jgi:hypothetical protein
LFIEGTYEYQKYHKKLIDCKLTLFFYFFFEETSAYGNINQEQRIENIKIIKESVDYSEFQIYFTLLENVVTKLPFILSKAYSFVYSKGF